MLFNSFNFFIVFPFIFLLYWIIPSKWNSVKKWWLILVSYLLYMNWNASFAIVLLFVTIITFLGAKLIYENSHKSKCAKLVSIFSILALLPLLIFKYYNFVNESTTKLLEYAGIHFSLSGLNWAVPIGISFYTFQALGYMLDVYYGRIKPENNFTTYVLFCSFFPQTASGPISKASELLPQIKVFHPFRYEQAREGLQILLWGIFLKVVVADRLGIYVDTVYENYIHYSGLTCFIASVFYSFQIYGDFAGYSLMAVGIGKCLGFDLVNNFQRPYLATSVTDFWKRWHISLTRWLTLYVYIPLGGSRCSKIRHYWNIMLTFLVSGLWHGANWTFVIWGAIHGLLQIAEKLGGIDPKGKYAQSFFLNRIKVVRILFTFLLVNFAWVFFRAPSLNDACEILGRMFHYAPGLWQTIHFLPIIILIFVLLLGREFVEEFYPKRLSFFNNKYAIIRWSSYLFMIALIVLYGVLDATQFIYVSF